MRPFLLASLAGILGALAHPRGNLFPLAYIALVPLWLALEKGPGFRLGFWAGWIYFVLLLYWLLPVMTHFGGLNPVAAWGVLGLLGAYLALFWGAFSFLARGLLRSPIPLLVGGPTVFVAFEFLRAKFLYGFPWGLLGVTQYRILPLIQIADLGGVYAVSWIVVFLNTFLYLLLRRPSLRLVLIAFFVLLCVLGYGFHRLRAPLRGEEEVFALIQGNIPQEIKWADETRRLALKRYQALSEEAASCAQVILWPETALAYFFPARETVAQKIFSWQKALGRPLVLGAPRLVLTPSGSRIYNSLFLIRSGKIAAIYDKQRLVPFGEFIPLVEWFPFLRHLAVASGDYSPGPSSAPLRLSAKKALGPLICFESIFPDLARKMVLKGATILLVATNDAWFDRTAGPYQHFVQAIFRAVETRRYLLRVANTGISGLIDPYGRVLLKTPLEETCAPCVRAKHLSYLSWYTRLGDLWAGFCVLITALLSFKIFYGRKTR